MNSFRPFNYIKGFAYDTGWDKYALKYATLLVPDTLYYLHKQVMYDYLERNIIPSFAGRPIAVLDVNCGTGNDFPFWLQNSASLMGIDGSTGMLNKACENYREAAENGKLQLYQGMIENIDEHAFGGQKFDVIYSITGGFSYINDEQFKRCFSVLKKMLNPGGYMVTAHLNTFCLPETIGFFLRGKIKRAFVRLKKNIPGSDGSTMYLRSADELRRLLRGEFEFIKTHPLICIAPPYQTDLRFSPKTLCILRSMENKMAKWNIGKSWADQVIVTCR